MLGLGPKVRVGNNTGEGRQVRGGVEVESEICAKNWSKGGVEEGHGVAVEVGRSDDEGQEAEAGRNHQLFGLKELRCLINIWIGILGMGEFGEMIDLCNLQ